MLAFNANQSIHHFLNSESNINEGLKALFDKLSDIINVKYVYIDSNAVGLLL